MGWGTADTEALTGFLADDKIPDMSASYAAALSDPKGTGGKAKAAPYNFFDGPTYSDALRGMLTWAADDWKSKGKPGKPKYVHMGANHPYPNAPKEAGETLAADLGFELLPPIVFALTPGDFSAQCLSLKSSGADYAYLGNTAGSNISVLNACKTAGVRRSSSATSGAWTRTRPKLPATLPMASYSRCAPPWPGRQRTGHEDGDGYFQDVRRGRHGLPPLHYVAGVCTALYMKEAVEWAAKNGGATGENVKKGFYQKADWVPAGMEGVCNPSTWTDKDHRGTLKVDLYRMKVAGATDAPLNDLVKNGGIKLEKVKTIDLPRKAEWLGW